MNELGKISIQSVYVTEPTKEEKKTKPNLLIRFVKFQA